MKSTPSRTPKQCPRRDGVTTPVTTENPDCDSVTDVTGGSKETTPLPRKTKTAPRIKVKKRDGETIVETRPRDLPVEDTVYRDAFGSEDPDFIEGLIGQLFNAGTQGQHGDGKGPNFMLAVIHGIEPRDQVESMLAAQMAAVHMATMTFARRLAHVDTIPQQDSAERAFNKLARAFATQVEALKRYRTGGEQKVTVEHVTVNDGGQAIVGYVGRPGEGGREK